MSGKLAAEIIPKIIPYLPLPGPREPRPIDSNGNPIFSNIPSGNPSRSGTSSG